jgi:hypothetical protein
MRRVNEFYGDFRMFGKWLRLFCYNLIGPIQTHKRLTTSHFWFVGHSIGMACGRRPCVALMHSMVISEVWQVDAPTVSLSDRPDAKQRNVTRAIFWL